MFTYVEDKDFLRESKQFCSSIVKKLENVLRTEDKINSQAFLVGSGARNLITQNEDGCIDFDYNLNIITSPDHDQRFIKETIRKRFENIMIGMQLGGVEDSTSSLTTKKIYFHNCEDFSFSIDLTIVIQDEYNNWYRLIHEKTGYTYNDKWYWNKATNSKNVHLKAKEIKNANMWDEVRKRYLNKKICIFAHKIIIINRSFAILKQ